MIKVSFLAKSVATAIYMAGTQEKPRKPQKEQNKQPTKKTK